MILFLPDNSKTQHVQSLALSAFGLLAPGTPVGMVSHPSGHTWVLGDTAGLQVVTSANGLARLIVDGSTVRSDTKIQSLLDRAVAAGNVHSVLDDIGGDGLFSMSWNGYQVLAGSISGRRRIFHASTPDGPVFADSALLLASILRVSASAERLAMRLCASVPHYPFRFLPLWDEIMALTPHNAFESHPDGQVREVLWWQAPDAVRSVTAGGEALAAALAETLTDETQHAASVTADLSGGLDSTSIVYLLAARGIRPVTFHARSVNQRNSDADWAHRAAKDLGLQLHQLAAFGDGARAFLLTTESGVSESPLDFPAAWWGSYGFLSSLCHDFKLPSGNIHFTGLGGDELFGPLPATVWSVVKEEGFRSLSAVRRAATATRTPLSQVMRALADRRSFHEALIVSLRDLSDTSDGTPLLGTWSAPMSVGRLLSDKGRELAVAGLTSVVESHPEPLDGDRGRHQMLESLLFQGEVLAQINATFGGPMRWSSPFLRRSVIESAAAVRASVRLRAGMAKPLLASAMARVSMPPECFTRPVTGEYSADTYAEFASRREPFLHELQHSQLAAAGLIDIAYISSCVAEPSPSPTFLSELEALASLERWLRGANSLGVGLKS